MALPLTEVFAENVLLNWSVPLLVRPPVKVLAPARVNVVVPGFVNPAELMPASPRLAMVIGLVPVPAARFTVIGAALVPMPLPIILSVPALKSTTGVCVPVVLASTMLVLMLAVPPLIIKVPVVVVA